MKWIKYLMALCLSICILQIPDASALTITAMDRSQLIGSEYAFQPNYILNTTEIEFLQTDGFTVTEADSDQPNPGDRYAYHALANERGSVLTFSWIYHNIGVYKGKTIDIQVTLKNVPDELRDQFEGIWIDTTGIGFMAESCEVEYAFYDHETHEPVYVKGNMTGIDLDYEQNLYMKEGVDTVYIFTDSVVYQNGDVIMSKKEMTDGINDERGMFTLLFEGERICFDWCMEDLGEGRLTQGYISFIPQGFLNTETPGPTENVNYTQCTTSDEIIYTIYQQVPYQFSTNYYDSFILENEISDCLSIVESGITIVDESGEDVSEYFTIEVTGQIVQAIATDLDNADFYNHYYTLTIPTTTIVENLDAYTDENGTFIANDTTLYYNDDSLVSNEVETEIVYTITSSITNGTITPSKTDITGGSDEVYTYAPNDGYYVSEVVVDGETVDIDTSYTFTNVVDNHDIKVTCLPYYTITTKVVNGSITPTVTSLKDGYNQTIDYSPDEGYYLESITVDGIEADIETFTSTYTFSDIHENHEIEVVYRKNPTISITKDLDPGDVNLANGTPTFIFKIEGTDYLGNHHVYYDVITFEDLSTLSKTITETDIPAGQYTISEVEVSRYTLAEVTNLENASVNGTEAYADTMTYDNVHASFKNGQSSYAHLSHNALCINEIRNEN